MNTTIALILLILASILSAVLTLRSRLRRSTTVQLKIGSIEHSTDIKIDFDADMRKIQAILAADLKVGKK